MHKQNDESCSSGPRKYWRTLDERNCSAQVENAAEFDPRVVDDSMPANVVSRRSFLGVLGATATLATAACSTHERAIVPYTKRPTEIVPGVANFYASTFHEGARTYPVLVKTREGRPIHITGNDEHPRAKGKTSTRAIADLASLYDPDRTRVPKQGSRRTTWGEAEVALSAAIIAARTDGKRVLLLTNLSDSPSRLALFAELKTRVPQVDIVQWEPAESDSALRGDITAFGQPLLRDLDLAEADVIVSLGADFLNGEDPSAIGAFASRRLPNQAPKPMSRLWVFEGDLSLTGTNADQRFTMKPSRLSAFASAIARELSQGATGSPLPPSVVVPPVTQHDIAALGIEVEVWRRLIADLRSAGRRAVVLCGEALPEEAHIACSLTNVLLGTKALKFRAAPVRATHQDLLKIVQSMAAGQYGAALIWGVNPAYAFADVELWSASFAKVQSRFWLGLVEDETAEQCQWILPSHHWLESWGDFGPSELLTLQQPVIAPLYESRQGEELLLAIMGRLGMAVQRSYREYIRARWQRDVAPADALVSFDHFFNAALHDGVCKQGHVSTTFEPTFRAASIESALHVASKTEDTGYELILRAGTQVFDGRYGNNGWLQELPDPITKNTWGNPLIISVQDARSLGLKNGDIAHLDVAGKQLTLPVIIQPGQTRGVLSLALGYGRKTGSIARGVGTNAFGLVGLVDSVTHLRTGVKLRRDMGAVRLALTQAHHRMEGRDIVRSYTPEEYAERTSVGKKHVALTTLYPDQNFSSQKWGMNIDLAACVGCSACVIACQSENNIATVGAEQVERGREMHWIRVDTYYEGPDSNPRVVHQPMLCQHCDHAPCENVCPVNATNHSPDGLNQMVYNRCVGTRYCANNCPYKVRRYNFFDYTSEKTEPADLVYNPEVTVRPRGVMEKCTFCVQRIEDGRMRAKVEGRELRDGDVTPACAAACPSGAIVFGNLKDPESRVAQLAQSPRGYRVLEELGTRPAITYLADLKNPAIASVGGEHE